MKIPLAIRFQRYVQKTPTCWLWTGTRGNQRYGTIKSEIGRKTLLAHRVAWSLEHGEIPDGLFVLHHCDNVACVNPTHLFLGTARDNTHDAMHKGRLANGERSGMCTISDANVLEIRRLRAQGVPLKTVAAQFNIHWQTVSSIALRKYRAKATYSPQS